MKFIWKVSILCSLLGVTTANDDNSDNSYPHWAATRLSAAEQQFSNHARELSRTAIAMNKAVAGTESSATDRRSLQLLNNLVCSRLGDAFEGSVECSCGRLFDLDNEFDFKCEYKEPSCTTNSNGNDICAALSYEGVIRRDNDLLTWTSTICLSQISVNGRTFGGKDLCVSVEYCLDFGGGPIIGETGLMCSCNATFGGEYCNVCERCENAERARGIDIDCTNINPEIVTVGCNPIQFDLQQAQLFTLSSSATRASAITPFLPDLSGSCTFVEGLISDQVLSCDCDNFDLAAGSIPCKSTAPQCITRDSASGEGGSRTVCANITTSVTSEMKRLVDAVVNNESRFRASVVDSCAYVTEDEYKAWPICMRAELCDESTEVAPAARSAAAGGLDPLCAVTSTLNGTACDTTICNSGRGVIVDCSQAFPQLEPTDCLDITAGSTGDLFSFFPTFDVVTRTVGEVGQDQEGVDGNEGGESTTDTDEDKTETDIPKNESPDSGSVVRTCSFAVVLGTAWLAVSVML